MVGMSIARIDLKTGLTLQEWTAEGSRPQTKAVEHSYLEHWLQQHGLSAEFWTGRFYAGVEAAAVRERLEADGKELVFTNDRDGYFTDAETARLMREGDPVRGIASIYASDRQSPHNAVAYGSLIASSGMASTTIPSSLILVVDDEGRTHGPGQLLDSQGQAIPAPALARLYDKLGDGTMLVSRAVMASLQGPEAGSRPDFRVSQFRAATPEWPGMMKGTLATSEWCERLGVEAIITTNAIKGDDGRLSSPGLKPVSRLWVNRKTDAAYGQQGVGPQVKGWIPEATWKELNPKQAAEAKRLAAVVRDPVQLAHYYMEQTERKRGAERATRPDAIYEVLKGDRYGQLTGFSKITRALERAVKRQWLEIALRGVTVPSAMAQPHGHLKPWEVCNRDLSHGAIVAYYRSPFPNVGAAAIAINNTRLLQEQDREAWDKTGVAYLPPWTAKAIAITDFDGDRNGYFVGYEATVPDLPEQMRAALSGVSDRPLAEQYEAGRAWVSDRIVEQERGAETRITPAEYPLAVKEFVQRTAPAHKPPEIAKQPKIKHSWSASESHSAALWRAWAQTAENPTGKVANAGMTLQSLSLELIYAPEEQREALSHQVTDHLDTLLQRAATGQLEIPDTDFTARMQALVQSRHQLPPPEAAELRRARITAQLEEASRLFADVVAGPNAVNLQTAVDMAKSAQGIDEPVHAFVSALPYKDHALRRHQTDPTLFLAGKRLPTNTTEPIGWGVEAVNETYHETELHPLRNEAFRSLFSKAYTRSQEQQALGIAHQYNARIQGMQAAKARLRERRPADQQPTLRVTSARGNTLVIEAVNEQVPIWRAQGVQSDWRVTIARDAPANSVGQRFSATLSFRDATGDLQRHPLGVVAAESVAEHQLEQRLGSGQRLTLEGPSVQFQAPYAQEQDPETTLSQATTALERAMAEIPEDERGAYLSALWHHSEGMGVALQQFPELIRDRLAHVPDIKLIGLQRSVNEVGEVPSGTYTVRFTEFSYLTQAGQRKTSPAVAIVDATGTERSLGVIDARSPHLPTGTVVTAHLEQTTDGTARMQVLERIALATPEPSASYAPTREELRRGCAAAIVLNNESLTAKLMQKGHTLNDRYRAETGDPGKAPLSYRHPSVVLSAGERQAMEAAISAAREGRPAIGPHRQERSREQVEIG